MPEQYEIRPFRAADLEAYLDRYEEVFGKCVDEEWFDWKYRANPYVDHVPIYVATADDELVGARSFFALPIRSGEGTHLAFQPCDTFVASGHRRRGLFTRMTNRALERYRAGDPEFCFNFPNEKSLQGNLQLGWRVVREQELYYRIQEPGALVDADDSGLGDLALSVGSRPVDSVLQACDSLAGADHPAPIERYDGVPADQFVSLYRQQVPDALHAPRTDCFLEWRYDNPRTAYETFILRHEGDPVAAIVVGRRTENGVTTAKFVDGAPRAGVSPDRFEVLLDAALERSRDADLVVARPTLFSTASLLRRGFVPDDRPPLSLVTETTTLVARPLTDRGWTTTGRSLDEPSNWATTQIERDTE